MPRHASRIFAMCICLVGCHSQTQSNNTETDETKSAQNSVPSSSSTERRAQTAQTVDPGQSDESSVNSVQADHEAISAADKSSDSQKDVDQTLHPTDEAAASEDRSQPNVPTVTEFNQVFHSRGFASSLELEQGFSTTFGGEVVALTERSPREIQQRCRDTLQKLGWSFKTQQTWPLAAGASRDELLFEKQGHLLSITTSGPNDGTTDLNIRYFGNVDVQRLPVPNNYVRNENPSHSYVGYTTEASIDAATSQCKQLMLDAGWKEFRCTSKPSSLPNSIPPNRVIGFFQGGFSLYLSVGRTPGYKDGQTVVNYVSTGILPIDLFIAEDAELVELEVLHGKASYLSSQTLADLSESISKHFAQLQFPLIQESGESAFIATFKSGDDEQILVDVTPNDGGKTSVQMIRQFQDGSQTN